MLSSNVQSQRGCWSGASTCNSKPSARCTASLHAGSNVRSPGKSSSSNSSSTPTPLAASRQLCHRRRASTLALASPLATPAPLTQALDYGLCAAQGKRDGMEDEVTVFLDNKNGRYFAGVFDGHCGFNASAWLKVKFYEVLSSHLPKGGLKLPSDALASMDMQEVRSNMDKNCFFGPALTKGFLDADKKVIEHLASMGGDVAQEGSTATAVFVTPGSSIVVAHVGDSQAVLCRKGVAVPLTTPHRVTGQTAPALAEIARIQSVGGWVDDGRVCGFLAVSRALGDYEYKGDGLKALLQKGIDYGFWDSSFAERQSFTGDPVIAIPEVIETPLTKDDELLILATDGLWDVLQPADAIRWARNKFKARSTAAEVAAGLADLAVKRHSADNISVIVIDLQGAAYWNPSGPAADTLLTKSMSALQGLFSGFS